MSAPEIVARAPEQVAMPIYLLHGLMGTCAAHCGHQIQAWRDTHRLFVIDLPGHGRSRGDAARPYVASAVASLRATMRRHGKGHLLGVSYLGGCIAARAALADPALVADLVLTGFVADIRRDVFAGWIKGFIHLGAANPPLAHHYDAIHGSRWRETLEVVAEECRESYETTFAIDEDMIADLAMPTLIVNGDVRSEERDAAERLHLLGPLIRGVTIRAAGHIVGHDQPAKFNLTVERFWGRGDVGPYDPATGAGDRDCRGDPRYGSGSAT